MKIRLTHRTIVLCPLGQAARRVAHFMSANTRDVDDGAVVPLFLEVRFPGFPSPIHLQREVQVTLEHRHQQGDMEPRYRVRFASKEPGPFPAFSGEMRIEGGEDDNVFFLALEGDYEPPLGLIGAGLDAAIDARIANNCARNLLRTIAQSVEAAYALAQAAKRTELRAG